MQNKIKALILLGFIVLASAFAEDVYTPKEPKKGQVMIVGRVTYKKPIDLASREESFKAHGSRNFVIGKTYDFSIQPDFSEKQIDAVFPFDDSDGYFYSELKPSKKETVTLNSFKMTIFGNTNPWYQFVLPGGVDITIPDDAVYVYIGTFEYELDYALRTVGFRHLDEYENAQKQLGRALGKDVELYRAAIEFLD